MAVSCTCGSPRRAWLAAPVPRPPHPTSPTRKRSLPAAWTNSGERSGAATVPASTPADDFRNVRREPLGASLDVALAFIGDSLSTFGDGTDVGVTLL